MTEHGAAIDALFAAEERMQVATAKTRRVDPDDRIARVFDARIGKIADVNLLDLIETDCFHRITLAAQGYLDQRRCVQPMVLAVNLRRLPWALCWSVRFEESASGRVMTAQR